MQDNLKEALRIRLANRAKIVVIPAIKGLPDKDPEPEPIKGLNPAK